MPSATRTKAKSVPMFVNSTISPMFANPANRPTTAPVRMVVMWGVWYFGWIFAAQAGSRPSRAIVKKMRGCPSWKTISTDVVAMTAPSEMMPAVQFMPRAENAVASGSAVLSNW